MAVGAVAGIQQDHLAPCLFVLIDKHLVEFDVSGEEPRYSLLTVMKALAAEELAAHGEQEVTLERHSTFYLGILRNLEKALRNSDVSALSLVAQDYDEIKAVLRWSLACGQTVIGLEIAGILWSFWVTRDFHVEGAEWLERLLEAKPDVPPLTDAERQVYSRVQTGLAVLNFRLHRFTQARIAAEAALLHFSELGDQVEIAYAKNNLANIIQVLGDTPGAQSLYEESLAIARETGQQLVMVKPLLNLGLLMSDLGRYDEALRYYQESLSLGTAFGEDLEGRAILFDNIGDLFILVDDPAAATRYLEDAEKMFNTLGARWGVAMTYQSLGRACRRLGDLTAAILAFTRAIDLRREMGNPDLLLQSLSARAVTFLVLGQVEAAETDLSEILALLQQQPPELGQLAAERWEVAVPFALLAAQRSTGLETETLLLCAARQHLSGQMRDPFIADLLARLVDNSSSSSHSSADTAASASSIPPLAPTAHEETLTFPQAIALFATLLG